MKRLGKVVFLFSVFLMVSSVHAGNNTIKPLHAEGATVITNSLRIDGFGSQFQTIIYTAMYADLNGLKFVYTPFKSMAHNYDNDEDFLEKKEWLINFKGNFETNHDEKLQSSQVVPNEYIPYFEANIQLCTKNFTLQNIKKIFRANKVREDYFDNDHFHFAIHIRRMNSGDVRDSGTKIPDSMFLDLIESFRNIYISHRCLFHIFSQGDVEKFEETFAADDIVLHINESIEDTFTSMVLADVLVTAPSSISYVAGILSNGDVYYVPFWHPPLPDWVRLDAFKYNNDFCSNAK